MNQLRSSVSKSFLFLFCLCLIKCGGDKLPKQIDPDFAGYITAFTSGVISNQSTIKVRLTEPYKDAEPGQIIKKELFDFSPEIEGDAYWIDDQTIEYRPAKRLPPGKLFEAEFYS